MSYEIKALSLFEKELKELAKKYPSLKNEYAGLLIQLAANPKLGTPLGKNCYKIRVAISSKGKGKSGGARVITCVQITKTKIFLIGIYDKSSLSSMPDSVLKERLKEIPI